jgi:hypothetical protein
MSSLNLIPIPPTAQGHISPVNSSCTHESKRLNPIHSFHCKPQLPALVLFEWFFTEKSFEWWKLSFGEMGIHDMVWCDWKISEPKCCLVSECKLLGSISPNVPFSSTSYNYIHFIDESRFVMTTKGTPEGIQSLENRTIIIQWNVKEIAFGQSELNIEIFVEPTNKEMSAQSEPPKLNSTPDLQALQEVLRFLDQLFKSWVLSFEKRVQLIVSGNIESVQIPPTNKNATTSREIQIFSKHFTENFIQRNWSTTLLLLLLFIFIPLIASLFSSISQSNSQLESLLREVDNLERQLSVLKSD